MIEDSRDRLMMSDSLRGMVPELEEETFSAFQDAFVLVGLVLHDGSSQRDVAGNLVGLSMEGKSVVKIDVRTAVASAYATFKQFAETGLKCNTCQLLLAEDGLRLEGPFDVSAAKMLDFDHQNKMCTLALDLIRS